MLSESGTILTSSLYFVPAATTSTWCFLTLSHMEKCILSQTYQCLRTHHTATQHVLFLRLCPTIPNQEVLQYQPSMNFLILETICTGLLKEALKVSVCFRVPLGFIAPLAPRF